MGETRPTKISIHYTHIYVCINMPLYIYKYVYTYIHTYTYTHIPTYTYIIHRHANHYIHTQLCMRTKILTGAQTHTTHTTNKHTHTLHTLHTNTHTHYTHYTHKNRKMASEQKYPSNKVLRTFQTLH